MREIPLASMRGHGPPPRVLAACLLAGLAAWLSGCFTVDGTVKADGSATLAYTYTPVADATEAGERARFVSPHVTVQSMTFAAGKPTVVKVAVDDVTKLGTASAFKGVTITRAKDGDEELLTIVIPNIDPRPLASVKGTYDDPKLGITVPGTVTKTEPTAPVTGSRVDWKIPLSHFYANHKAELTVRWKPETAAPNTEPKKG
ncbi:MAG: hypothetical protein U0807_02635 [Candidatus Binatia bacterium]